SVGHGAEIGYGSIGPVNGNTGTDYYPAIPTIGIGTDSRAKSGSSTSTGFIT
ncbi:hypothetical protein KI387_036560, partial [Taxus chinensis]